MKEGQNNRYNNKNRGKVCIYRIFFIALPMIGGIATL